MRAAKARLELPEVPARPDETEIVQARIEAAQVQRRLAKVQVIFDPKYRVLTDGESVKSAAFADSRGGIPLPAPDRPV